MNQRFTVSLGEHHIAELSDPDRGITTASIREMTPALLTDLNRQAEGLDYEPAKKVVTRVGQNFRACGEFGDTSVWRQMATQFADGLEHSFRRHNKLSLLSTLPLNFTDLAVQHYPQTTVGQTHGIGIHRDHNDFINLVVVLLLHGACNFYICKDREGNGAVEIEGEPGQLLIMRGGGFAGGGLSRPLHYVGPIDERGRLSFGLRQLSSDPEAAARLRKLFSGETTA
ncbi:MAG: hypothetical protein RJB39_574 [Candidatus Parcubacteria bacterium]|jgi:hypothetical protein